ncbi:MAG: thiamine pyrophosphate-binding protein [Calditrichaeota bacterium]|nr:MAG: thiamine pyrophosphate-binding protein [Calditrichota bacterium]
MNGGEIIARFLKAQGVRFLFTLCGGHIAPILVACQAAGIRVVDTRHEATAVFAADAVSRLTGTIGVAAVTAGPGATNTITAVKNAQLAGSPLLLLGGATATLLKGRGALQDIDQMALMKPHVKWQTSVGRLKDLLPALHTAVKKAREGVPGPVFVECPVDLLYPPQLVRQWYLKEGGSGQGLRGRLLHWYLRRHVNRLFAGGEDGPVEAIAPPAPRSPSRSALARFTTMLRQAERPVLLLGSQAMRLPELAAQLPAALEKLGIPVFLSGMARGLLGRNHPLQCRHQRRQALRQADLVCLAGVPCDFRLDYGRQFSRKAAYGAVNINRKELRLNRKPTLALAADPAAVLLQLAEQPGISAEKWTDWLSRLKENDRQREAEIDRMAAKTTDYLNPLALLRKVEAALPEDTILVGDGGDFVASASYVLHPRGPYGWLDPGPFGTLGVGAGFALAAKLCRPQSQVWLIYGDGAAGFSLMEFDTFARHRLPIVALVGNDGSWMQIAREQVELLGAPTGTELARCDYHQVAQGLGGVGLCLSDLQQVGSVLRRAVQLAGGEQPVLINALLGRTEFRKGSISM